MQWSIDVGNEWIVQNGVSFSGGEEGVVVLCHGNGDDHLNVTLFVPSVPDSRSGLRADTQRLSMHLPAGGDVVRGVHGHVKRFEELVIKDSFCLCGAHLIRLCFDVHAQSSF